MKVKLVKCSRCNGSGKYVPLTPPPDPKDLVYVQEYLRAEERHHTGIEPVWNDAVIPQPERCATCHGAKKVPEGGVL